METYARMKEANMETYFRLKEERTEVHSYPWGTLTILRYDDEFAKFTEMSNKAKGDKASISVDFADGCRAQLNVAPLSAVADVLQAVETLGPEFLRLITVRQKVGEQRKPLQARSRKAADKMFALLRRIEAQGR